MSMRTRGAGVRRAAAGAAVAVLVATGCGAGGQGGSATDPGTLIAYAGQAGDYQVNFNPYSPTLIDGPGTIYEPLFYFNAASDEAEPQPRLGTDYAWNEDGTVLSVTLRDDARWTDGERFTADDVVFTMDMVRDNPTMNSTGFDGVTKALDDTHVTITFDEPAYTEAPQILGKLFIVPEHLWGALDAPAESVMAEPVGTGPFVLEEFKPQAFTLRANPDYYGGEPELEQIRYIALSGNQSGADALNAGQIDFMTGPVPDIAGIEENYPGYKAITVPWNQIALFTCSSAELGCEGPQTDPAVRRAIYHAMDREQLNALAFQGTASEISPGFALPDRDGEWLSDQLEHRLAPMEPQLAEATRLLTEAGYTKGSDGVFAKDGRKLELTVKVVSGWTDYITAVNTLSEQLGKAGVKLTAQQVSWNEWSDARGRGQYELLIDAVQQGPSADPYYSYSYFFAGHTTAPVGEVANPGFARYDNASVNEALAGLKRLPFDDADARQPYFDVIQTALERDMPYIPVLTGGTTSEYHADKFSGWPTADDLYAFPAVWSRPDNSQIYLNLEPNAG
ncbi:ABC transporter substrate-binding protein [Streptomyces sp. TRM 70351]|uniref:ABC transporter substrate-binding protein n=1 Tax=Streptomyces sp. TRM 70351 TaxID=3116552 RepID=UPI002E7B23BA|nr:ABC transporter substrate-binding protein [Streptomyces sp. TRM 70351]MEE1928986.1 ABC transporter substrate-binding protein [Streptomyces sp. TRM 70351]